MVSGEATIMTHHDYIGGVGMPNTCQEIIAQYAINTMVSTPTILVTAHLLLLFTAVAPAQSQHIPPNPNVKWDELGFSLNNMSTSFMWHDEILSNSAHATFDGSGGGTGSLSSGWSNDPLGRLVPLRELSLHPASTILNYGQGIFEGIKAFRRENGEICVFRCNKNAQRFRVGASRLMIPPVPEPVFIDAVEAVVAANAEFVPPFGAGALYLRPILFGSGKQLGVSPSPRSTFCIYCSPVGNYFKGGVGSILPIRLLAQNKYQRAANKGIGFVKGERAKRSELALWEEKEKTFSC